MSDTFETRSVGWPELDEAMTEGLRQHAEKSGAPPHDGTPLTIAVTRGGRLIGGLIGKTVWGWLSIDRVWVLERMRGQGLGRKLMRYAETEAARRGCKHAMVDTMSFQSQGFYEKMGYEVWGTLDDFPEGHQRIFFQKHLQ